MATHVETDVLVVGAGPAGASTALFLAPFGVKVLMVSRHSTTADTPRAHITNQRAMEAFRDAGLEEPLTQRASPGDHIEHSFFLESMVGEELARVYSWGNDPRRKGDYEENSPCDMCDLPQTELEPVVVSAAAAQGATVRFDTEFVDFEQDADGVTARLRDRLNGEIWTVRAKYMVGADGARSRIVEQLGIPLSGRSELGDVFNVLCNVDLTPYVRYRHGSLYAVIRPGSLQWSTVGVFRMVKPWTQWLAGLIVPIDAERPNPTQGEFEDRIRELIGDPSIPVEIISTSVWSINDVVADYYSVGRIHCMGDAVHRHPPTNGLGSNTCVQDAFNLAWKLALVVQGKAAPALLDSYNVERQPVGAQIVARANKSMEQNQIVWDLLGGGVRRKLAEGEHMAVFDTPEGRATLRRELDRMKFEYHAQGVELNRCYQSAAVLPDGTKKPEPVSDVELYYQPSTWPGSYLPHVWLGRRLPGPKVSTLDVAGKRRFTLLTGPGGNAWRDAARHVLRDLDVEIAVISIGPYQDYEDIYGRWRDVAGVGEDGCVLVRPDYIVAWRSPSLPANGPAALTDVMRSVLQLA